MDVLLGEQSDSRTVSNRAKQEGEYIYIYICCARYVYHYHRKAANIEKENGTSELKEIRNEIRGETHG